MKLGSTVGMRDDPDSFSQHVRRLEDAGVEYLWCGEAYTSDAVSALGFVAAVTKWAQIGSSILPLYTRTPSVLAMTAVGLDRLSGGRFNLGIGASGPQVIEGFHGVPYDAPLARTAEIIEICRSVWRRDRPRQAAEAHRPPGQGPHSGLRGVTRAEERGDDRGDRRGLAAAVLLAGPRRPGLGRRAARGQSAPGQRPAAARDRGRRGAGDR